MKNNLLKIKNEKYFSIYLFNCIKIIYINDDFKKQVS